MAWIERVTSDVNEGGNRLGHAVDRIYVDRNPTKTPRWMLSKTRIRSSFYGEH